MRRNALRLAPVTNLAAAPTAADRSRVGREHDLAPRLAGPSLRLLPAPSVEADLAERGRFSAPAWAGAAPRPSLADLIACHTFLRLLGVSLGAVGQPDRAASLLDAADVLSELLDRPESPVRLGLHDLVGPVPGRRAPESGRRPIGEDTPLPRPKLSRREREVLALLVEGCSNADIADALSIARRTAETHVAHILDKLGVSSRTAAIAYAVRHGLIA